MYGTVLGSGSVQFPQIWTGIKLYLYVCLYHHLPTIPSLILILQLSPGFHPIVKIRKLGKTKTGMGSTKILWVLLRITLVPVRSSAYWCTDAHPQRPYAHVRTGLTDIHIHWIWTETLRRSNSPIPQIIHYSALHRAHSCVQVLPLFSLARRAVSGERCRLGMTFTFWAHEWSSTITEYNLTWLATVLERLR